MPTLTATEPNTAVSEAANYGATAGQQIAGDLYRGSGGKFTSGPTDAQLKDLGMERATSDALLALLNKKEIDPAQMEEFIKNGWVSDAGNLTPRGRGLATALKNKNLSEIKRLLALAPKGRGGAKTKSGGGGKSKQSTKPTKPTKEQITAENREKVKADLETAGLPAALQTALFKYRSGGNISDAQLKKLAKLGLVIFGTAGYRMSPDGNKLVRAADKGDVRAAQDALQAGKDRVKKQADKERPKVKPPTQNNPIPGHPPYKQSPKRKTTQEATMPLLTEATTKTVNGRVHDMSDFLVVEDKEKTTTWHLPVKVKGKPDHRLMGAAWAALYGGYRGQKYTGPQKQQAISKLKALYKSEGMEVPMGELATINSGNGVTVTISPIANGTAVNQSTTENNSNGSIGSRAEEAEHPLTEMFMSLGQFLNHIRRAFDKRFRTKLEGVYDNELGYMYIDDVTMDHPVLGNSVVVTHQGQCFAVEWAEGEGGEVDFADVPEWRKVYHTWVYADETGDDTAVTDEAETAESEQTNEGETISNDLQETEGGQIIRLEESDDPTGPLVMEIAVIKPGWGNKKDNHYYGRDMLRENAHVFKGAKMYTTDHRANETSVITEVSQVIDCPVGFTDTGAPIAKVGVFHPTFAQTIRNRQKLGLLESLHVSIMAQGKITEKQFEENGRKGHKVESIAGDPKPRIDWVTNAGAGGHALRIAESEPTPDPKKKKEEGQTAEGENGLLEATLQEQNGGEQVTYLTEAEINEGLANVNLPKTAKEKLATGKYQTSQALQEAVTAEIAYIKSITGSGQPPATGTAVNSQPTQPDPKKLNEALDKANAKFLGGPRLSG